MISPAPKVQRAWPHRANADTRFEGIESLWKQLFNTPMPTHNRQYLERRIAYRIEESDFAQRDPALLDRNRARIDALIEATKPKAKAGRGEVVKLVPGTMPDREFAGVMHRVVAMADGQFEYKGKPCRSLTAIANEITGTRWAGPAFFGLRDPADKGKSK